MFGRSPEVQGCAAPIVRAASGIALCLILVASAGCRAKAPAQSGRTASGPSIVLLTVDTLRADHLPFYGSEHETAPTLAGLASRAVVYDKAESTSSWTVPSVTTWLTGVYPFTHGVFGGVTRHGKVYEQEVIPAQLTCLAEVLQENGYQTLGVTANAHLDAEHGFGRGFETFSCLGFSPAPKVNAVVRGWLTGRPPSGKPLFLWAHYFDPHAPYIPREPWFRRFAPDASKHEMKMLRLAHKTWPRVPEEIRRNKPRYFELVRALYDSEIAFCDQAIGQLLQEFPELEQSWIVFASDHGEEIGDHNYMGHGHTLYGETVRVPLFVRPPRGAAPGRVTVPVSSVDIPRTILAIAGIQAPAGWQGSVLPGLPVSGTGPQAPALAHLARFPDKKHLAALIGPRWKIIRNLKTGSEELYDLEQDPWEHHDLATTEIATLKSMSQRLNDLVRALPPPPEDAVSRAISKRREEQLRNLGYLR